MGHHRLVRGLVVDPVAAVPLVQPGKDLVRLVDDYQIKRRSRAERSRPSLAAREFAPHQIHTGAEEAHLLLARLDTEELEKLVLPLADERLRYDQQNPLRPFGPALSNDEARLDRLPEADLVRENAPPFLQPPQREDHRVDLVRVGIDPRLSLRRRKALPVIRPPDPHQVLSEKASIKGVEAHGSVLERHRVSGFLKA